MIEVREYKDSDLEKVNDILTEAFNIKKGNVTGEEFLEVVATYDDYVCGYLLMTKILNPIVNKYYYFIDYVCVLSKYRGLGVSDELMSYAEEISCNNKAMYMQLTCSSFRVNAHKLYERCGFIKRDSDIFRKELV